MYFELSNTKDVFYIAPFKGASQDEILDFDLTFYRQAKISQIQDVISPAQGYLATLSPEQHRELFHLYNLAKEIFSTSNSLVAIDNKITAIVANIIKLLDLNNLQRWVLTRSNISIPGEIKQSFADVDEAYERSKTYIYSEYVEILTMAIALRFILPIWGDYLTIIKDSAAEFTKEIRAYGLLKRSELMKFPALERLLIYINVHFTKSTKSISSTLAGIGREEIPDWLCSLLLVRRLTIIDLTSDANSSIINNLFGYVRDSLDNLDRKFKEPVNDKRPPGTVKDTEKDPSFLETYRVKQDMSTGDIAIFDMALDNIHHMVKVMDPTVPDQLINHILERTEGLSEGILSTHNVRLTQWIISPIIDPVLLEKVSKRSVINGMIISQILCHHWGMHQIGLLVTGINHQNVSVIADGLARPTQEQLDLLDKLYPYQVTVVDQRNKQRQKLMNNALLEINALVAELLQSKKAVRTPEFLTTADIPNVNRYGHMVASKDLPVLLIDLLVKVNEVNIRLNATNTI